MMSHACLGHTSFNMDFGNNKKTSVPRSRPEPCSLYYNPLTDPELVFRLLGIGFGFLLGSGLFFFSPFHSRSRFPPLIRGFFGLIPHLFIRGVEGFSSDVHPKTSSDQLSWFLDCMRWASAHMDVFSTTFLDFSSSNASCRINDASHHAGDSFWF